MQLGLSFAAPRPAASTWVCGICHCVRPDNQLWCSHLADRAQREHLHQLLGDCDNATCVPVYPCPTCCDAIAVARIPWNPAYRCLGCNRGPGDEHIPGCESEGRVPSVDAQLALIDRCEATPVPVPCRVPNEEERRVCAEEFPEFVAPMPPLRRSAPSTRTAESVECPTCHSMPGDRCRNYRGKGCAPHRQRVEASKAA